MSKTADVRTHSILVAFFTPYGGKEILIYEFDPNIFKTVYLVLESLK